MVGYRMPRKYVRKVVRRKRPGMKRRGGMRKRFAVKTYAFKRWIKTIYIQNSEAEDPLKLISSDANTQIGSTGADAIDGTYQAGGVFAFSLSDVVNNDEFTTLFDQYRIAGIKLRISPVINVNTNSANSNVIPEIMLHRDLDDVAVPTGPDSMRQYQDTKIFRLNRPINYYCKPSALIAQDGTTAAIVPFGKMRHNMFLDCDDPTVVYPTWKFWLRNVALSAGVKFHLRIDACFYTQFKNVR